MCLACRRVWRFPAKSRLHRAAAARRRRSSSIFANGDLAQPVHDEDEKPCMLRSATIIDTPTRHLLRVNPQALDLGTSLPFVKGGRNAREARFPAHFHKHRSSAQPHKQQHASGESSQLADT